MRRRILSAFGTDRPVRFDTVWSDRGTGGDGELFPPRGFASDVQPPHFLAWNGKADALCIGFCPRNDSNHPPAISEHGAPAMPREKGTHHLFFRKTSSIRDLAPQPSPIVKPLSLGAPITYARVATD